ncbi:MAG TPA: hypothetical protein VF189_02425 [Patescibacteria group bacterium]
MDQLPPQQQILPQQIPNNQIVLPQTPQNPPPKNKMKGLLLFEVGLLEVVFVLLLLGLVFGVLNYFNILKISSVIPQLSFLPHRQSLSQENPPNTAISTAPKGPFIYDTEGAYNLVETFAKKTLNDDYLPKSQDASESAFIFLENKNIFTSPWNVPNGKVGTASAFINAQAILTLSEDSNIPSSYKLTLNSFNPPVLNLATKDAKNASQLASQKLFRENLSNASWNCQGSGYSICNYTKITSQETIKYQLEFQQDINASSASLMTVSLCQIPSGSSVTTCQQ